VFYKLDSGSIAGQWTDIPFVAGWDCTGPTFQLAKYRKDASGTVHITGFTDINPTTSTTTQVATLPVGFRPGSIKFFVGSVGGNTVSIFDLDSSGVLRLRTTLGVANQAISWDCTYLAEA